MFFIRTQRHGVTEFLFLRLKPPCLCASVFKRLIFNYMTNMEKATKLSVATLAIMNVTAVVSLRGLPAEAEYGVSSAFYYLFAAIVFLIPTALVAAELAAMFSDKQGGVFRWVG